MVDFATLAERAAEKIETPDDYWSKATAFLQELADGERSVRSLSLDQKNWLHGLRQDLSQPWD